MNKTIITLVALLFASTANASESDNSSMFSASSYAKMCMKAVDLPSKFGGESDLKGNPKLADYCNCFDKAFTASAMKALGERQAGKAPPPLEQQLKEQLAMKNSCRSQLGLPLAVK